MINTVKSVACARKFRGGGSSLCFRDKFERKANNSIVFYKEISFCGLRIKLKNFDIYFFKIYSFLQTLFFFCLPCKYKLYKIIPLGSYCFPRCITTFNQLKPKKEAGELSCPFDLAFFNDIEAIISLVDNRFVGFYDGLEYDDKKHWWVNNQFNAVFNHDGDLSREQFIERYNKRIKNFYDYLADKMYHKYILMAKFRIVTLEQVQALILALRKYMEANDFDIIIINQANIPLSLKKKICGVRVHIINQNHNCRHFQRINRQGNWVGELKQLKQFSARKIYYEATCALRNIIKR